MKKLHSRMTISMMIFVLRFFQKKNNKAREYVKLDLKNEEQNVKFRLLKQRSGWTDCFLIDINQFWGRFMKSEFHL